MGYRAHYRLVHVIQILTISCLCNAYLCDTVWTRHNSQKAVNVLSAVRLILHITPASAMHACQQALIQRCGVVTCNITREYCVDGECYQCEDSCSEARIGHDISGNVDCYRTCPVYMERVTCFTPSPKVCGPDGRFIGTVVLLAIVIVILLTALAIVIVILLTALAICWWRKRDIEMRMNALLNIQETHTPHEMECVNGIGPPSAATNPGATNHEVGPTEPEGPDGIFPDPSAPGAAALDSTGTNPSCPLLEPSGGQTTPKRYASDDELALVSVAGSALRLSLTEDDGTMTSPAQPDSTGSSSTTNEREHFDILRKQNSACDN